MADYSLFDVLGGGSDPARYDLYDQPGVGLTPAPPPQAQAGMGGPSPSLAHQLLAFLKTQSAPPSPASGGQVTPLPGPLAMGPGASSTKGFLSNSRQGLDLATVLKIAGMVFGGGAGAAGAAGGGGTLGALGGAAQAAGGGSGGGDAGGVMGLLGGIFGGKKAPSAVLPQMQVNTSRLYG